VIPPPSNVLFATLASDEIDLLCHQGQVLTFAAQACVFKAGDPATGLYLVLGGLVEISALVGAASQKVLAQVGEGDFLGEMALLESAPRSANATAVKDSRLMFIPKQAVLELLRASPRFSLTMMREVCHRMRGINERFVEEFVQAERLALVGRFARSLVHDFKSPLAIIGMSMELAAMEGAAPETLYTTKTDVRKQLDKLTR